MDIPAQCRRLVEAYLQENGYSQTLEAFKSESSATTQGASSATDEPAFNLQQLVELWMEHEALPRKLQAITLAGKQTKSGEPFDWHQDISSPIPSSISRTLRDIHLSSILSVGFAHLARRVFDTSTASYKSERIPCIVTSSADKRIAFTSTHTWELEDAFDMGATVLAVKLNPVYPYLMLSGAMDGTFTITNLLTREQTRMKEHAKYVVRAGWSDDGRWFCTAAYDKTICIHEVIVSESDSDSIDNDEFANPPSFSYKLRWRKTLPTNPEACLFLPGSTHLAFSRRDDNHINYVSLPEHSDLAEPSYDSETFAISKYNLNETLDSHISFCILSMAIHPSGEAITLQTDTPISRIILLPFHSEKRLRETLYTNAEQSEFSNPRHAWLPDGTGAVVSSDDGIVRLVDLHGKVKVSIPAHGIAAFQEADAPVAGEFLRAAYQSDRGSSVIRDLCIVTEPKLAIVSVGLDKTIRVAEAYVSSERRRASESERKDRLRLGFTAGVVVKGGVWKNTEDEILKAAISKYGKNQWARISSLLVRKTPKQCKARWYEWLDPSIKKTEWSKEEDEKLLHLAKLMPTQWRTIAPIVGRTATQCLERYQKLLDDAEQRDNEELGLAGVGDEAGPSADDVRRLRPGEVDPDPETKPARPDPIDMDEDEKEMLSEARARLANTQGKKAKRKARERQLEEARRLAMLQKKRELKAAGIQTRFKTKQKGMDYNADIPFEKAAAPGFYDTTEETAKVSGPPVGRSLKDLEGGKRKKDMEDAERRKRQKKAKEATAAASQGGAMANFQPAKDQQIQRMKEEQQIGKRRKLQLPGAQVSEQELEEIVKIGQAGESARLAAEEGDNEAGRGLLGEYSALAHAKDARTPRTAPQADNVMAEARNLRNMAMQQTPLLGDENAELHELTNRPGTGYEGATPARSALATPNPLATPFRRDGSDVSATPRGPPGSERGPGATPLRTPRDNLAINTPYTERGGETPREQKLRQRSAKSALEAGFAALPAPKNDFELVVPEDDEEDGMDVDASVPLSAEDAAERDARIAARKAEEQKKALARRSQAIKLGLPRPVEFDPSSLLYDLENAPAGSKEQELERIVAMEMVKLLEHDSIVYPVPGGKRAGGGKSSMEQVADADLETARAAVHLDLASFMGFPGASEAIVKRTLTSQLDSSLFDSVWQTTVDSMVFDASTNGYVEKASLSGAEIAQGQAALLDVYKKRMTADAARAAKVEKKLGTILGGYQARSKALAGKLAAAIEDLRESTLQLDCFNRLADNEEGAIPRRLEILQKEVRDLERREKEGQNKYTELSQEKRDLTSRIEELELEYAEAVNEQAMAAMDES